MSIFIKELVRNKISQLSTNDLIYYGNQYGFTLSQNEAIEILTYIQNNSIDPFNGSEREKMLFELANITSLDTAKKANTLFIELINTYGLTHLLN